MRVLDIDKIANFDEVANSGVEGEYLLVDKKEYEYLRRTKLTKSEMRRQMRYNAICQWLTVTLLIAGVICGTIAMATIFFTGAQAGRDFDELLLHAAMEMLMCITPGLFCAISAFSEKRSAKR